MHTNQLSYGCMKSFHTYRKA